MRKLLIKLIFLTAVLLLSGKSLSLLGADKIVLKGSVVDSHTKMPVAFCSISIAGTTDGAVTDIDGRFEVRTLPGDDIKIVISHISYQRKEVFLSEADALEELKILLEPKELMIDEIVVSASLYEQPLDKLSKSALIISQREIKDNFQSNMIDMLSSRPGFTQVWEYHSPIILRGMNSKRILIMKDGNRRVGTFPGGYFAQDMNIYDSRKVEIVKGPGSVIYGSGAVSGIINIISPEPFGNKDTKANILTGYGSNNSEFLEILKICHKQEQFGISVNGKFRQTDDMLYGGGETADNSDVKDIDFSVNTGYKFTDENKVLLNISYHNSDWGKPRGFNGPTKRHSKIRNEEERLHTSLNYSYTPGNFIEAVNLSLYYDQGTRDYHKYLFSTITNKESSLELVHYKDNYGGFRLFSVMNFSESNKLTAGLDGYMFMLDNPAKVIDYYNNTEGKLEGYIDAGQADLGVFINDEWQLSEKVRMIAGIRYDQAIVNEGENSQSKERNESRSAFSGNFGFVWSLDDETHLSVNVGRAFRMPTAEELFTEVISCKGVKLGNPKLKPEFSWGFDLGFRGYAIERKFKYDLALFYNILDDYINETLDLEHEGVDFTYLNTEAENLGGELSASYRFDGVLKNSNSLFVAAGMSYVYGIDKSGDEVKALFGVPPFQTTLEFDYRGLVSSSWLTGYSIKFQTEYAASQIRVADVPNGSEGGPWGFVPSDPHTIFNFSLGLNSNSLPWFPKFRLIIRNILDNDYKPFGSYIPAIGRNVKMSMMLNI